MPLLRRAFPLSVYVPDKAMDLIVRMVAELPSAERKSRLVIFVKGGLYGGEYKAHTDQVVPYNPYSNLEKAYPKTNLVKFIELCRVRDVTEQHRVLMGAPRDNNGFLVFMKEYWDSHLTLDSKISMLICNNLRGVILNHYVRSIEAWRKKGRE